MPAVVTRSNLCPSSGVSPPLRLTPHLRDEPRLRVFVGGHSLDDGAVPLSLTVTPTNVVFAACGSSVVAFTPPRPSPAGTGGSAASSSRDDGVHVVHRLFTVETSGGTAIVRAAGPFVFFLDTTGLAALNLSSWRADSGEAPDCIRLTTCSRALGQVARLADVTDLLPLPLTTGAASVQSYVIVIACGGELVAVSPAVEGVVRLPVSTSNVYRLAAVPGTPTVFFTDKSGSSVFRCDVNASAVLSALSAQPTPKGAWRAWVHPRTRVCVGGRSVCTRLRVCVRVCAVPCTRAVQTTAAARRPQGRRR